jgi:hypothetical protein
MCLTCASFDFVAAAIFAAGIALPSATPSARCRPPLFFANARAIQFFAINPAFRAYRPYLRIGILAISSAIIRAARILRNAAQGLSPRSKSRMKSRNSVTTASSVEKRAGLQNPKTAAKPQ